MNQSTLFRRSLHAGTGRAPLLLRENPHLDVFEDIRDGIRTNHALDQQVEGPRAAYMVDLINLSGRRAELVEVVIEGLGVEEEGWNLEHLFAIGALLAADGEERVRAAMYGRFAGDDIGREMWCGAETIAGLDGLDGFLFVVERKGRHLIRTGEALEDESFVRWFERNNHGVDLQGELERAARGNPAIARYIEAVQEDQARRAKARRTPEGSDYEIITGNLKRRATLPWAGVAIEELSHQDTERLAADFRQETDPKRRELYLRLFSRIRYPGSYRDILGALVLKQKADWPSGEYSFGYNALAWFRDEKVRTFALERLASDEPQIGAVSLLVYNYRKGDARLLTRLAQEIVDQDALHDLTVRSIAVYRRNHTPECRGPMEILYRKGNCGIHRLELLEVLHRNDLLSEEILEEMQFDSFAPVRKLYRRVVRDR